MCPLSCISLASGRNFEQTLANEHIEDILHDKRMYWLTTAKDMFICFDYRMLRDWGDCRHWEKISIATRERLNRRSGSPNVEALGFQ
jgi:hypothetical protein